MSTYKEFWENRREYLLDAIDRAYSSGRNHFDGIPVEIYERELKIMGAWGNPIFENRADFEVGR